MQFPYGISDFQRIIENRLFYVDRTYLIPNIERAGDQLIFLRPRRFGKSLLLSMLENYYDIAKADKFKALFGHLSIGKDPTPLHSSYVIMRWDFSLVGANGTANEITCFLHQHINERIAKVVRKYSTHLEMPVSIFENNTIASFESLLNSIDDASLKLYLLIDEYDNFANELMMGASKDQYGALLHGEGTVRSIFKAVKGAASGMGLERVFITGVSPIAMSDITSAYNVASNIYLLPKFNQLCGFTEAEITDVVSKLVQRQQTQTYSVEQVVDVMRLFYNGYRFCKQEDKHVYNPTLALYFLRYFSENCAFPEEMLDENLAMDTRKIHYIAKLTHGAEVIGRILDDSQPLTISKISERFGVRRMVEHTQNREGLLSLLYYLGALTHATSTFPGEINLCIPNLVMRKLYLEEVEAACLPDDSEDSMRVARALYMQADIAPLCDMLKKGVFEAFSNRDYRWSDELTVKTAFLATLFNDVLFIMDSEPELNCGYADLSMIVRPDMRHYDIFDVLMEFKFIKLSDIGMTGEATSDSSDEALHALPQVKKAFADAEQQLHRYIPGILNKYGRAMKLCSFAVVAVGFDRLLWKRVR